MKAESITCDVCGKQKQQTNHWWLFAMPHILSEEEYFSFEAKPWVDADVDYMRHACGQECLTKAMSQWMQAVHAQGDEQ